jgi:hypothetical protein
LKFCDVPCSARVCLCSGRPPLRSRRLRALHSSPSRFARTEGTECLFCAPARPAPRYNSFLSVTRIIHRVSEARSCIMLSQFRLGKSQDGRTSQWMSDSPHILHNMYAHVSNNIQPFRSQTHSRPPRSSAKSFGVTPIPPSAFESTVVSVTEAINGENCAARPTSHRSASSKASGPDVGMVLNGNWS